MLDPEAKIELHFTFSTRKSGGTKAGASKLHIFKACRAYKLNNWEGRGNWGIDGKSRIHGRVQVQMGGCRCRWEGSPGLFNTLDAGAGC